MTKKKSSSTKKSSTKVKKTTPPPPPPPVAPNSSVGAMAEYLMNEGLPTSYVVTKPDGTTTQVELKDVPNIQAILDVGTTNIVMQALENAAKQVATQTSTHSYSYSTYSYTVTVDYTVNVPPVINIYEVDGIMPIANGSLIRKRDKDNFVFKAKFNDEDSEDQLKYRIELNNVVRIDFTNIAKNELVSHTIPFSSLKLGNNTITVRCSDGATDTVVQTFTVRRMLPDFISLKSVRELMLALGYTASDSSIGLLKKMTNGKLSFEEIIDSLE